MLTEKQIKNIVDKVEKEIEEMYKYHLNLNSKSINSIENIQKMHKKYDILSSIKYSFRDYLELTKHDKGLT